jgi:hypothetical protein
LIKGRLNVVHFCNIFVYSVFFATNIFADIEVKHSQSGSQAHKNKEQIILFIIKVLHFEIQHYMTKFHYIKRIKR